MNQPARGLLAAMAGGAVLLVGAIFALPREAEIARSIDVEAPPEAVYALVVDMEAYQRWSPWAAADPTLKITYGDKTSGVGASYAWEGEASGTGTLTVVEAVPPSKVVNALDFGDMGSGTATWTFEAQDGGTHVTWRMHSEAPGVMGGVFALFADGMIGPSFEEGLRRLKEEAEKAG